MTKRAPEFHLTGSEKLRPTDRKWAKKPYIRSSDRARDATTMETEEAPPSAEIMPDRETGYFDRRNSGGLGALDRGLEVGRNDVSRPKTVVVDEPVEGLQRRIRAHSSRKRLGRLGLQNLRDDSQALRSASVTELRPCQFLRCCSYVCTLRHEQR
jgi:hypothetical protein